MASQFVTRGKKTLADKGLKLVGIASLMITSNNVSNYVWKNVRVTDLTQFSTQTRGK